MSVCQTCQRCGVSAWHPEVRACTFVDCELRRPAAPDDLARNREAERFWSAVESVPVHTQSFRTRDVATS